MAEREEKHTTRRGEEYSKTDDDRAREAAEHPLETAAKPAPKANGVSWAGPAAMVAVAVVVLLVLVAVFA